MDEEINALLSKIKKGKTKPNDQVAPPQANQSVVKHNPIPPQPLSNSTTFVNDKKDVAEVKSSIFSNESKKLMPSFFSTPQGLNSTQTPAPSLFNIFNNVNIPPPPPLTSPIPLPLRNNSKQGKTDTPVKTPPAPLFPPKPIQHKHKVERKAESKGETQHKPKAEPVEKRKAQPQQKPKIDPQPLSQLLPQSVSQPLSQPIQLPSQALFPPTAQKANNNMTVKLSQGALQKIKETKQRKEIQQKQRQKQLEVSKLKQKQQKDKDAQKQITQKNNNQMIVQQPPKQQQKHGQSKQQKQQKQKQVLIKQQYQKQKQTQIAKQKQAQQQKQKQKQKQESIKENKEEAKPLLPIFRSLMPNKLFQRNPKDQIKQSKDQEKFGTPIDNTADSIQKQQNVDQNQFTASQFQPTIIVSEEIKPPTQFPLQLNLIQPQPFQPSEQPQYPTEVNNQAMIVQQNQKQRVQQQQKQNEAQKQKQRQIQKQKQKQRQRERLREKLFVQTKPNVKLKITAKEIHRLRRIEADLMFSYQQLSKIAEMKRNNQLSKEMIKKLEVVKIALN